MKFVKCRKNNKRGLYKVYRISKKLSQLGGVIVASAIPTITKNGIVPDYPFFAPNGRDWYAPNQLREIADKIDNMLISKH